MSLLRFLLRESRATVAFAILVGLLSGAGNSGLMIFINSRLIHGHPVGSSLAWGFAGLCLAVIVTRTIPTCFCCVSESGTSVGSACD